MVDFNLSTAEIIRPIPLNSSGGLTIPFNMIPGFGVVSDIIDVRDLASYYFEMTVSAPNGATSNNSLEIFFLWFPTPNGVGSGGVFPLYTDTYAVWATQAASAGGVFDCAVDKAYFQDQQHGPYLQILFQTPAGNTQTVTVNPALFGSTRQLSGPFMRQGITTFDSGAGVALTGLGGSGTDGILAWSGLQNIANGVTLNVPCALGYGKSKLRLFAGAGALSFLIRHAGLVGAIESFAVPAGTAIAESEFTITHRALLVQPRNLSGVASTYQVYVKTEYQKF